MYFDDSKRLSLFRDVPFYVGTLRRYVKTGIAEILDSDDALDVYLANVMNDPYVKVQVLGDDIGAAIFMNVMMRFIYDVVDKMKFKSQMVQSDIRLMGEALQWSERKKQDGWQALVFMIDGKYGKFGFDKNFYLKAFNESERLKDDKVTWEKMIYDWEQAIKQKVRHDVSASIDSMKKATEKKLNDYMTSVPEYIKKEKINKEEFIQAWGMMNGAWNTSDFQRLLKVVRMQQQYPQIIKISNKMGRISSDEGRQWMSLLQGTTQKIEYSSHSDILGVTLGDDINAMMPMEMACASDEDMENIFLKRLVSHQLQVFRYKSEIMKPSRQLSPNRMIRRGPMIVCIDTSSSMIGMPEKISRSALLRILTIAHQQQRLCYLIGFSVSINPIDVGSNPSAALAFFSHNTSGETNARKMLEKTFELLESNERYLNADILWVSDFRIPIADKVQLMKIQQYRTDGTCFYGLQIGISKKVEAWKPYFDEIERIEYISGRTY